jgi:hypothetical protein
MSVSISVEHFHQQSIHHITNVQHQQRTPHQQKQFCVCLNTLADPYHPSNSADTFLPAEGMVSKSTHWMVVMELYTPWQTDFKGIQQVKQAINQTHKLNCGFRASKLKQCQIVSAELCSISITCMQRMCSPINFLFFAYSTSYEPTSNLFLRRSPQTIAACAAAQCNSSLFYYRCDLSEYRKMQINFLLV